jgi:dienelactone hydrolase
MLFRRISTVFFIILFSACANTVKFEYDDPWATNVGDTITIRGYLGEPEGEGPFPAVVLQHGCSGITDRVKIWAALLNSWGYVTLIVDSNGPRYVSNGCGKTSGVPIDARAYDAYAAKSYLSNISNVDSERIAILGFSQGARSVLCVANDQCIVERPGEPFKAAISFYPWCTGSLQDNNAPLMVLIGEKDDWAPASACHHMDGRPRGQHEATFVFYPNAYHFFDIPGINNTYMGHRQVYDSEAAADSRDKVKRFLAKYLSR